VFQEGHNQLRLGELVVLPLTLPYLTATILTKGMIALNTLNRNCIKGTIVRHIVLTVRNVALNLLLQLILTGFLLVHAGHFESLKV
jgi:hypothetical protein